MSWDKKKQFFRSFLSNQKARILSKIQPKGDFEVVQADDHYITVRLNRDDACSVDQILVLSDDIVVSATLAETPKNAPALTLSIPASELRKLEGRLLSIIGLKDKASILLECTVNELIYPNSVALIKSLPLLELAPSYGFFGGVRRESLVVEIGQVVDEIIVQIDKEKTYLNFSGLTLIGDSGDVITSASDITVTASTSKSDNAKLQTVIANTGFHSELEDRPWLKITFSKPKYISKLQLRNRGDQWGSRAQGLAVYLKRKETELQLFAPFSSVNTFYFATQVAAKLPDTHSAESAEELRISLLKYYLEQLQGKVEELQQDDFFVPLQLLSTWASHKSPDDTHEFELKILALFVFMHTRKTFNITLAPFSRLLPHADDLQILEQNVNNYRNIVGLEALKFTKHGAAKQGMLVQNVPRVLTALQTVMDDMTAMNLQPCLAYGTLLGACRDKSFIEHDDDVDILIKIADQPISKAEAFERRQALMQSIDKTKYRVAIGSKTGNNLNIHIFHKETNIMIDVFPYWIENGLAQLHMENMKIRGICPSIFEGRNSTCLYGHSFDIPVKPEAFLEERYGPGWTVSDRFHEWPWKIKQ